MLYINGLLEQHLIYFVFRRPLVCCCIKLSLEISNHGSSYSKAKSLRCGHYFTTILEIILKKIE